MLSLLYSVGLELTLLMAAWLCLSILQRDASTPGRNTFLAMAGAAGLWCLGDLLYHRGVVEEWAADRMRYVGVLMLPCLWAGLAAHASGISLARRAPWFPAMLCALQLPLYALMYTRWASLFVATVPNGPDVHGPLWWWSTAYSYVLVITGSVWMVRWALRERSAGRWHQRALMGLAPFIPLAGNAVYIGSGLNAAIDPTPLLFGAAMLALRSAIFGGSVLQTLPLTQYELLTQLPLGVLVTDRRGVVVALNPAAEARLGLAADEALGRDLDSVLETCGDLCAETSPVASGRREVGQLVLLDRPKPR